MGQKRSQIELEYDWRKPVTNMSINVKPKKQIKNWPNSFRNGYISSLSSYWAINGGKLAVFKDNSKEKSGYLIVDGYDELNKLFEVEL